MWSSQLRYFLKCSLNLLLREQPLLPVLDVFGGGWVGIHPFQGTIAPLQRWPKTQHTAAENPGAYHKQDQHYRAVSLQEQGTHHPSGDPLNYCRQASDSQLLTSWVSPEQEAWPCYICPWVVGIDTGQLVFRAIRHWMVVAGYKIINVYKPPHAWFTPTAFLMFPHLSLYVGDFKHQHVNWVYSKTSPDGESLASGQKRTTLRGCTTQRSSQFLLGLMECRHLLRSDLCKCWPWQLTTCQMCSRNKSNVVLFYIGECLLVEIYCVLGKFP